MKKRAQVTVYVLIGLAIVFAFGFLLYARDVSIDRFSIAEVGEGVELAGQKTALKSYIESCIEQKTKEAIDLCGLKESSEGLIRDYVEANLIACIDFAAFEDQGLTIERNNGFAVVDITDDAVLVDVYYPVTIIKDGSRDEMSRYRFYMARAEQEVLPLDQDGTLQEEIRLVTEDGDAELVIPEGAVVTKDGEPYSGLEFNVVDKNFDGLSNTIVIGEVAYQGTDGVYFDPAATLIIKYKQEEIPPGVVEEDLVIGWYDKQRDFWKALPTSVDTINKIVEAPVSHFSEVAVISSLCKLTESNTQVISAGIMFKEMCRECEGADIEDEVYFTDPGVVPYDPDGDGSSDSEGSHFGKGCVGPEDWDLDDQDSNDCPECHSDCVKKANAKLPKSGDGIKDEYCVCKTDEEDNVIGCEAATPATPMTYGYNSFNDVGGDRTFTFHALEEGESCEAPDNNVKPVAEVKVDSPSGDAFFWTLNGNLDDRMQIQSGANELYVKVINTREDACAEATATITLIGFGILPDCERGAQITENCHCGYQNVDLDVDETKFCCESGVVVDSEHECSPLNGSQCGSLLSANQSGCFCGNKQYDYFNPKEKFFYCCPDGLSEEPCTIPCQVDISDLPQELQDLATGEVIRDVTGYDIKGDKRDTRMCDNPWNCDDLENNLGGCILYWWARTGGNLDAVLDKMEELGYATDPVTVDGVICRIHPLAEMRCDSWPSCEGREGQVVSRGCTCVVRGAIGGSYYPDDRIIDTMKCPPEGGSIGDNILDAIRDWFNSLGNWLSSRFG